MNRPDSAPAWEALPAAAPVTLDPLIGRDVEIHSTGGIQYHGVIRSIRLDLELGELFELGSSVDPMFRRLVYVTDRRVQIRESASGP